MIESSRSRNEERLDGNFSLRSSWRNFSQSCEIRMQAISFIKIVLSLVNNVGRGDRL